jgi:hypothetical protein
MSPNIIKTATPSDQDQIVSVLALAFSTDPARAGRILTPANISAISPRLSGLLEDGHLNTARPTM